MCVYQTAVDESVVLNVNVACRDHLKGIALVKADSGAGRHCRASDELCAQRIARLAGALEVKSGKGILKLRALEDLHHNVGGREHGVHGVRVKAVPEVQQLAVAQAAFGAADGVVAYLVCGRGVGVAVAVCDNVDGILKMHAHDLIADLAEHDGKQVKALEADRLVGRNEHSAALFEAHQMV